MKMRRTPSQILSSLWHRDYNDYFKYVPKEDYEELWWPKIMKHIVNCEHQKCKETKELYGKSYFQKLTWEN